MRRNVETFVEAMDKELTEYFKKDYDSMRRLSTFDRVKAFNDIKVGFEDFKVRLSCM